MKKNFPLYLLIAVLGATAGCSLRGSSATRDGEMEGMTMSRSSTPGRRPSSPVQTIVCKRLRNPS